MYPRPIKYNFLLLRPSGHNNPCSMTRSIHGLQDYSSSSILLYTLATTVGVFFWMINNYHLHHLHHSQAILYWLINCYLQHRREKQFSSPVALFFVYYFLLVFAFLFAIQCSFYYCQPCRVCTSLVQKEGEKLFSPHHVFMFILTFLLILMGSVCPLCIWFFCGANGEDSSVPPNRTPESNPLMCTPRTDYTKLIHEDVLKEIDNIYGQSHQSK